MTPTPDDRKNQLKKIILSLHSGKSTDELKEVFKAQFGEISSEEIASMEQELINSGELTAEQITKLCDLHVEIFKEAITVDVSPNLIPGHPLHTYHEENTHVKKIIGQLKENFNSSIFESLTKILVHYTRLQNQLFPLLEQVGFSAPSQVMWAKQDEIKALIKKAEQNSELRPNIYHAITEMIVKEEKILFPTALEKLTEAQWIQVKNGEEEIGFAWVTPGNQWIPVTPSTIHQPKTPLSSSATPKASPPNKVSASVAASVGVLLNINTGTLSLSQLDLMLRHLPLDISFIGPDDEVLYYSNTPERLFPRSPAIIGRNVMNCHPPKSQDIVKKILAAFKDGSKDSSEFWIQMGGKFIYIRYFAVRDSEGNYQGTLEVSQDLTHIKTLEGERKLLNWDEEI
ncbi:MAG: DUF438 domain-containing protein [Promethearchaeota archaeon]